MKTIFISAFQSFISRNILNTGVLDELLNKGHRVVIFVQPSKKSFYKETYTHHNVIIEDLDLEKFSNRKENLIKQLAELLIDTNVIRFRMIKKLSKEKNYFKYLFRRSVIATLGKTHFAKNIFRNVDLHINKIDAYRVFFDKYKPDVVFAPDVFGLGDVLLLKSAKYHDVKNIGMVASWDNNTAKGLMRVMPDILLVQNEIIKEESINIQKVPENIIKLIGIAHYDFYRGYKPQPREIFFKQLDLAPSKRLMVYSPAGEKFIATDWQVCEILKQAYKKGQIPEDVITLIRVHPANPVDFKSFLPDKHFRIENPGVKFGSGDKRKELDKNGLNHLLDTLNHSDLLINVLSSIAIDAAVLDIPIITIGFEGWEDNVPFGSSIKRYHRDENMAKLLALGGTKVVRNPEELIAQINRYLENPGLDKMGREKIVEKQCWKLDGKAKERIANAILE